MVCWCTAASSRTPRARGRRFWTRKGYILTISFRQLYFHNFSKVFTKFQLLDGRDSPAGAAVRPGHGRGLLAESRVQVSGQFVHLLPVPDQTLHQDRQPVRRPHRQLSFSFLDSCGRAIFIAKYRESSNKPQGGLFIQPFKIGGEF